MSKIGRYSADRKKIEQLTTTAKNITVADCGTIFMLDGQSLSADVTHTLPHPGDAGNGWWCKFLVEATGSNSQVLDLGGDDVVLKVRAKGMDVSGSATFLAEDLLCTQIHGTANEGLGLADQEHDTLTITGEAVAGSQLEVVTDGSKYYILGSTSATGSITLTDN